MKKHQEALNDLRQFVEAFSGEYPDMTEEYGLNKTVKAFGELVDKATPMKPLYLSSYIDKHGNKIKEYVCPRCKTRIIMKNHACWGNDCRQAIDWSEEE